MDTHAQLTLLRRKQKRLRLDWAMADEHGLFATADRLLVSLARNLRRIEALEQKEEQPDD